MIDISALSKDDLQKYVKEELKLDVELDLSKGWAVVLSQVKKLQAGTPAPVAEKATVADAPKATHILNRDTGFWFPYTEQLRKHLTNAIPCDENGKPV